MTVAATVDFDIGTQSLDALRAAAYRLIGTATCEIERTEARFICKLTSIDKSRHAPTSAEMLRTEFLNLVTDENLRERIAAKTDGVRNLILSLAFGALANRAADDF